MHIDVRELYTKSARLRYGNSVAYAFKVPVEEAILSYVREQELPDTADGAVCRHAYLDPDTRVVVVTLEKRALSLGYLLVPLELVLESEEVMNLIVTLVRGSGYKKKQPLYKTLLAHVVVALSNFISGANRGK